MPSQFRSTLNQLIFANFSAAEINGANRAFVAYAVPKLTGVRIMIHGVVWSINTSLADRPNARLALSLQRGLIITQNTTFPAAEDIPQMAFFQVHDVEVSQPAPWFPARPYPLDPGDSYGLVLALAPLAAFAGPANLYLTVFGTAEPVSVSEDMNL